MWRLLFIYLLWLLQSTIDVSYRNNEGLCRQSDDNIAYIYLYQYDSWVVVWSICLYIVFSYYMTIKKYLVH